MFSEETNFGPPTSPQSRFTVPARTMSVSPDIVSFGELISLQSDRGMSLDPIVLQPFTPQDSVLREVEYYSSYQKIDQGNKADPISSIASTQVRACNDAVCQQPPTPMKKKPPKLNLYGKNLKTKRLRTAQNNEYSLERRVQVLQMDSDTSQGECQSPGFLGSTTLCTPFLSQYSELSQNLTPCSHSVSMSALPTQFPGSSTDFIELELLGSGSFGKVYAVERRFDGHRFALKQIIDRFASRQEQQRRLTEVRALGTVGQGSAHIVPLNHTWSEPTSTAQGTTTCMYILMELCTGGSLAQRMTRLPPPNQIEALDIFGQLVLSLYACHSRNVAHGDIKAENVYYDRYGRLKLGDFGLASFLDASTGQPISYQAYNAAYTSQGSSTSILHSSAGHKEYFEACSQDDGDARYISFDMLNERVHYKAGDIFSLGISMFELLTGTPLSKGGEEHTALRTTTLVTERLRATERYCESFIQILQDMVCLDPLKRPTVESLLQHELLVQLNPNTISVQKCYQKDPALECVHSCAEDAASQPDLFSNTPSSFESQRFPHEQDMMSLPTCNCNPIVLREYLSLQKTLSECHVSRVEMLQNRLSASLIHTHGQTNPFVTNSILPASSVETPVLVGALDLSSRSAARERHQTTTVESKVEKRRKAVPNRHNSQNATSKRVSGVNSKPLEYRTCSQNKCTGERNYGLGTSLFLGEDSQDIV